ncbi:uncharacterized protein LOC120438642 [Oreochromis aureus]|uniref:Sterile alpha motif domain-containing protein 3-like n=1 Tax=Oreochromis aureus TaxID=47969 RepID=A0AAZ1XTH0_OREAU|nr:uncharacterized protein LOC120438642 [Oreochromis aureus]
MEATGILKLRVILDKDNAEKLILPSCPNSVQALIDEIKSRLNFTFDFRLQFHDPDFDNALCNFFKIEDLPAIASVKVVRLVELDRISTSTDDTILQTERGEVNFLPSYPSGETRESLKTRRLEMVEEFKKTSAERDIPLIHQHMMRTFALRREEIVTTSPPVSELKDRWPALFHDTQLIGLYKKRKTGRVGERMEQLLLAYGKQDKNDIYATRTAALAGLPMYLKEDSSEIFKTCKDEIEFYEATIALVADVDEEEVPGGVPFSPRQVFIVLEDQVVMTHHSWTDALVCLFGLIYALHLNYPEKCTGFFEFIQVVLLKLDDERKQLKPKLQTLKNELV